MIDDGYGYGATYLLPAGDQAVALIDCGNDPQAKVILAALARRNLKPEAVKAIFLTHGHPDHTAGCKQLPAAEVMALEVEVPLVEERAHATALGPSLFGLVP